MLKNFKKISGNFFRNRHKPSEYREINPRRGWNIILVLFVFVVIATISFSSYMYLRIDSGSFFVSPGGSELPVETIDRSELKKAIKYYETKNELFQEAKNKKPEVIDPSL